MKDLNALNEYRKPMYGMIDNKTCGNFIIPSEKGAIKFHVIASVDGDWDHVSVSIVSGDGTKQIERCPKWDEMCYIKDLFFEDEEEVIQFHPKKSEYVNLHPYVLHMWRPHRDFLKPFTL